MNGPFLELSFFVGKHRVQSSLNALVKDLPQGTPPPRKIRAPGVVGLRDVEEVEVYDGILVLRTEGDAFSGPSGAPLTRAKKLGRRVYERFVQVADDIPSAYGAILVEYSLEDLAGLRRSSKSLAFRNFFVSEEHLEQDLVEEVVSLAGETAFVEKRRRGVYISMTAWFNPQRAQVDPQDAMERSAKIAAVIARSTMLWAESAGS